jgi:glycosyltransferase involved in cell wall biosynthesis
VIVSRRIVWQQHVDGSRHLQWVKPRSAQPGVEYIGEINESQKNDFVGNALALMFTIDWPEPFGVAMIEALACGTPVVARPYGSVPEVLRDGVSGLIATEFDDLVKAVRNIEGIPREGCRKEFETRFTAEVMATGYERVYLDLMGAHRNGSSPRARFEKYPRRHDETALRKPLGFKPATSSLGCKSPGFRC